MVGVTKKEVSQMTKYYLKMDNIMKNMFVVDLSFHIHFSVQYTPD